MSPTKTERRPSKPAPLLECPTAQSATERRQCLEQDGFAAICRSVAVDFHTAANFDEFRCTPGHDSSDQRLRGLPRWRTYSTIKGNSLQRRLPELGWYLRTLSMSANNAARHGGKLSHGHESTSSPRRPLLLGALKAGSRRMAEEKRATGNQRKPTTEARVSPIQFASACRCAISSKQPRETTAQRRPAPSSTAA
jgi:hypothetical protein